MFLHWRIDFKFTQLYEHGELLIELFVPEKEFVRIPQCPALNNIYVITTLFRTHFKLKT